jgi:PAS domain S-box-containing protein
MLLPRATGVQSEYGHILAGSLRRAKTVDHRCHASPRNIVMTPSKSHYDTPVPLDRDGFMRRLIASLGHLNEGILGSDIAGAYIMNVGLSMGAAIEAEYKHFWGIERSFTVDEYAHVIVDLKQKIQGNFSVVSKSDQKVVVRTTSCPFDDFVRQSPSLCFMTSSVFGGIAARNFGYAKVVLHRRIALGDDGCYVTVYLRSTPEAEAAVGREYTPDTERASPDIAEQLRLMQSLRALRRELSETHSRWDIVVRGAAEAICVLDPSGAVTFANARWRDLLGVEGEELVGTVLTQLVHPANFDGVQEAVTRALGGERVFGAPWKLRRRDGSWCDVSASLGPVLDEAGRNTGLLAICHDVTEERETQRLKDEFLALASHELRTPLATIKGFADLLLRTLDRQGTVNPAQLAHNLRQIRGQAERLTALGTDLLDAARFQSGEFSGYREEHDLDEIVSSCVASQRAQLSAKDEATPAPRHTLVIHRAAEPLIARVDRPQMERLIAGLVDNAVKYSPQGGEVTVRTERSDHLARVQVEDRGIGIPAADFQKLFSPFFRASNAPSRHFGGLGIGLYLAKATAEAHGGTLSLHSVEGEGTTATLTLPLAVPVKSPPSPEALA